MNEASKLAPGDKLENEFKIKSEGSIQKFIPVPDGQRAVSDVRKPIMP